MEPKIIEKGAFKVAGLQTYGSAMSSDFAAMWGLLMDGDLTVPDRIEEHQAFGICSYVGESSEEMKLFYMASVEVSGFDNLPVNTVGKVIPANTYAVFTYQGVLDAGLMKAFHAAYQWLEASEYERGGPYDLEFYGPQFTGPQDSNSVLEIWVPIQKMA
ncbi:AraC family transcriptional regulator [bacterium]|nr:MAG: AraC family transcriptional regulator [bacterium]